MTIQNEHKIQYNIYNMYRKIKLGKNSTMTDASIMWFLYLKKMWIKGQKYYIYAIVSSLIFGLILGLRELRYSISGQKVWGVWCVNLFLFQLSLSKRNVKTLYL